MGMQPSGESTSMTREEYLRVRDEDRKNDSLSLGGQNDDA